MDTELFVPTMTTPGTHDRHGVDPEVALELLLCWNRARCRPPLEDEEVTRTVQNITRLHEVEDSQ